MVSVLSRFETAQVSTVGSTVTRFGVPKHATVTNHDTEIDYRLETMRDR
jgi:hypothetical protein